MQLDELIAKAVSVDGVRLIRAWLTDVRPEEMRVLGDRIKERSEAVVAVLGSAMEKKASILAVASKQAVERGAHAGKLVRELSAKLGGSGGGRPDSAMGGGSEPSRAQEALDAASACSVQCSNTESVFADIIIKYDRMKADCWTVCFAKLPWGAIPSMKVFENEDVVAFYDIAPQAQFHDVLFPACHRVGAEITTENSALVARVLRRPSRYRRAEGLSDGSRIVTKNAARWPGDGRPPDFHLLAGADMAASR